MVYSPLADFNPFHGRRQVEFAGPLSSPAIACVFVPSLCLILIYPMVGGMSSWQAPPFFHFIHLAEGLELQSMRRISPSLP